MKKVLICSFIFIAIACTEYGVDEQDSLYEISKIEASFEYSTKSIYDFGSKEIALSWEAGDTITVVAGLNYRYFVADESGTSTTFSLSSEHSTPLEAHRKETVYAITGRYEIKDYTYALTKGSLVSQNVSGNTFPMNIMRASSDIDSDELKLKFSHLLSYYHLRIPQSVVIENNYEMRICFPNEFLFPVKKREGSPSDCNIVGEVHVEGGAHPYISGDNWYEGSQLYEHLLLNVRDGQFVSFYNKSLDYIYKSDECLVRFPTDAPCDSEGFVDAIVAANSSETVNYILVYGSKKPYTPYFSKPIPEGGVLANSFINVNLDPVIFSTDFSKDGEVKQIQRATIGKGIDLVFMADFYIDKDMGDGGEYEKYVKESVDYFFSYDPYSQYRDRFNIFCVKAICPYSNCRRSDSPLCNDEDCFSYAKNAITDQSTPLRVVVLHNPNSFETVTRSHASAYGETDFCIRMYQSSFFDNTLAHELSHGLAHLYDEYQEWSDMVIPEEEKQKLDSYHAKDFYLNVDYRNDPSTVPWADLMADSRFALENIGIYDKAWYSGGLYKSSTNSIMNNSHECKWFNAQSRKAIYINLMKASEGEDWQYNYEDFVKFDEIYRNNNPAPNN